MCNGCFKMQNICKEKYFQPTLYACLNHIGSHIHEKHEINKIKKEQREDYSHLTLFKEPS